MNIHLRQRVGMIVLVGLLAICQIFVPLTPNCLVSAIVTAAICIVAFVILRRKGQLGKRTENPLFALALLPLWIAIMGGNIFVTSTIQRSNRGTWLQQGGFILASVVQWVCVFFWLLSLSRWPKKFDNADAIRCDFPSCSINLPAPSRRCLAKSRRLTTF